MIIKAGETLTQGASKYLNVFSASRAFSISSKDENLEKTIVKAGYSYDLEGYRVITLHNDGQDDLDVEFEMSTLRVVTGSSAGVEIVNNPSIQRIIEPISVSVNTTLENGTVHVVSASLLADKADITIAAGESKDVLLVDAGRKSALIQVISETRTPIRIGGVNVARNRGIYASGSKGNPAIIPIDCQGVIRIYNESEQVATVSVTELLT